LPVVALFLVVAARGSNAYESAFVDPGFEQGGGRGLWQMSLAAGTEADFTVDDADAAEGLRSALVTVGKVAEWGMQFGQSVEPLPRGTTCTFAVMAKAVGGPVPVSLQIERSADPWDRAGRTEEVTLTPGKWQELHATFTVPDDFPEGWFAYIACTKPDSRFRVDAFRLYKGTYAALSDALAEEVPQAPVVRVLDTGLTHDEPAFASEIVGRRAWTQLTEAGTTAEGDPALTNDRIAVVIRRDGALADLYSLRPGQPQLRATLRPVTAAPIRAVDYATVTDASQAAGAVDLAMTLEDGTSCAVSFRLKMGQGIVQVSAGPGVESLEVAAPARFAVLPDFFADDIVLDAPDVTVAQPDLPAENFLLLPAPDGNALVMAVWGEAADIPIDVAGEGGARTVRSARVPMGGEESAWVALLSGTDIWHVHNLSPADANQVVSLDWHAPYPAQWRMDWHRADGLTDSWEMAVEKSGGGYVKQELFGGATHLENDRRRWTTVLGWFQYPCWINRDGSAYAQPLSKELKFDGPALIYPINRIASTPLDEYTVVDVVRSTLGVGPCEYILDVEGQASQYRGRATCGTRDLLNPIYQAGRQKAERARIEQALVDVIVFIRHIRGRIEQYRAFGRDLLAYLADQKAAHPELAPQIAQLEEMTREIEKRVAARREKIKTPEEAQKLADEFRATLLDYEGPDAFQKCRRFTEAWVDIGGNQDELVGECRWAVKVLRQKAVLLAAAEPGMADMAREIGARSQEVLRNPAAHEGARH
jgi:hypothetical protein